MVVVIGAMAVAGGGFWASYRQSNFNAEIRAKNEEIARLQLESTYSITGGDSFAEMIIGIQGSIGYPTFVHHGKFPLYGVKAKLVDVDPSRSRTPENLMGVFLPVGDMIPGHVTPFPTALQAASDGNFYYNVFFTARNGSWTEELRMKKKANSSGWAVASIIRGQAGPIRSTDKGQLFRNVSPDYPLGPNGEIDWVAKPAPAEQK